MSTATDEYRVVSRSTAMIWAAATLTISALLVWGGMIWVESYGERLSVLQAISPDEAAAKVSRDLRIFSVIAFFVLLTAGSMLVRYSQKALRSQSLPPIGSWVVEGQHVRRGREATSAAWVLTGAGMALMLSAAVIGVLVWRLAGTI